MYESKGSSPMQKLAKFFCIQINFSLKPYCAYYKLPVEKGMELKGEQRWSFSRTIMQALELLQLARRHTIFT